MPKRIIIDTKMDRYVKKVRYEVWMEYTKIRQELLAHMKLEWERTRRFIRNRGDKDNFDEKNWPQVAKAISASFSQANDATFKTVVGISKNSEFAPLAIYYEWGTGIYADKTNPYYNPAADPYRNPLRGTNINAPIVGRPAVRITEAKNGMLRWSGRAQYTQMGRFSMLRWTRGSMAATGDQNTDRQMLTPTKWSKFYEYIGGKGTMPTHWFRRGIKRFFQNNSLRDRLIQAIKRVPLSDFIKVNSYRDSV